MGPSFRIVMRSGPTPGKVFPLEKNEIYIGRDLSNDLVINDPEISRRHSRLLFQNTAFILEDLGSTNGTSVNGQRLVSPYILNPGEVITLGERISLIYEAVAPAADATVSAAKPQAERSAQASAPFTPALYPPAYSPAPYDQAPAPQARPAAPVAPIQPSRTPTAALPQYQAPQPAPAVPPYQPPQPIVQPGYPPAQPPPAAPYQPAPQAAQPVYPQTPAPPPDGFDQAQAPFSGQVPYTPGPEPAEPSAKTPIWSFIVIGVLLLIILVLVVDDFHLWCPLLGMCG
jgi:pSer/pThr/pTyr-binding forkhead associated (FHA) protein